MARYLSTQYVNNKPANQRGSKKGDKRKGDDSKSEDKDSNTGGIAGASSRPSRMVDQILGAYPVNN